MSGTKDTELVEEWRAVVGYEGLYEVSNHGRVKSVCRRVEWQGTMTTVRERILSLCNRNGYRYVVLCNGGRKTRRNHFVHRLVLEAFVGPAPKGTECRHYPDGNRSNNRADNLSWATRKDNLADRDEQGTMLHGEKHVHAIFTNSQVRRIIELWATGKYLQKEIAAMFGTKQAIISGIVSGKTWRRVTEGFN